MKYKLELYGWEVEATGHSISDKQVEDIQSLMKEKEVDELWEVRHDLEENEIIDDLWSPDLFHESKPLDNSALICYIYDEDGKEVSKFPLHDIPHAWEVIGDEEADKLSVNIPCDPNYMGGSLASRKKTRIVDNIFCTFDENKGGCCEYEIESDTPPTAKDFYYVNGCIETPDGDWDYIESIYIKQTDDTYKELEVHEYGDNMGKASSVLIYRKDGTTIE
jgi:hypothetical protein